VWAGFNVPTMKVRIHVFGVVNVNKGAFLSDISFETSGINNLATEHNKPEELKPSEPLVIRCVVQKVTITIPTNCKFVCCFVMQVKANV